MNQESHPAKPRILVAPLDWGLGHATRCIPVIKELIEQDCYVVLAGEGSIKALLTAEFPKLEFLDLKGYGIKYGKSRWDTIGKMFLQIPQIIEAMDEEHNWLHDAIDSHRIDAVIADNRYGLFSERIPSIFITHQLLIKTTAGNTADGWLQKLNYEYINAFTQCWVPDAEGENNLAGALSHPEKMPSIPVKYVGALSRFQKKEDQPAAKHLLVILSGPEPQRTLLEEKILAEVVDYKEPILLIRGLPGSNEQLEVTDNIKVENHLSADDLQKAIEEASYVISRCGYSTVMDLMTLQKPSILIPTPGQTEQEYLATHLMNSCKALCIAQEKFRLKGALDLAHSFPYRHETLQKNSLSEAVKQLKASIKTVH
jgi:uncharacterized protein (TIGR00661 family)